MAVQSSRSRGNGASPTLGGVSSSVGGGLTPAAVVQPKVNPLATPAFKIESVVTRARWLKIMVYGEHGVGKTKLAGTAAEVPSMRDCLMISAESGDLTLADADQHGFENIDVIRCTNFKMVSQVHDFLKQHCVYRDQGDYDKLRELEAKFRQVPIEQIDEPRQYRTLMIDSLTEVDQFSLNAILGVTEKTRLDDDVANAEWGDYRANNDKGRRMIRAFRDLPMHCIFTAARGEMQDEAKRMWFSPALTGQLKKQAQGFMDVVGYLVTLPIDDKGKIPRRLWVQPAGKFHAKCRFPLFKGAYFDNPTMLNILKSVGLSEISPPPAEEAPQAIGDDPNVEAEKPAAEQASESSAT